MQVFKTWKLGWRLKKAKTSEQYEKFSFELAKIGTPSAVRYLLGKPKKEMPSYIIEEAIEKIRNPESLPVLMLALRDDDQRNTFAVAEAIGKIGDPSVIPMLREFLSNPKYSEEAAFALNKLGSPPKPEEIIRDNIFVCAGDGDIHNVRRLLEKNVNMVRSLDYMKRSPLHRAASGGKVEIAKILLDSGANVNAKDEYHWTPLSLAAESNKPEMIKFLLAHGADISARDSDLRTALHRAAEHNSVAAITILLETASATLIPAKDDLGSTAKGIAERMGYGEVFEAIERYE